jgi:hypothetical protein
MPAVIPIFSVTMPLEQILITLGIAVALPLMWLAVEPQVQRRRFWRSLFVGYISLGFLTLSVESLATFLVASDHSLTALLMYEPKYYGGHFLTYQFIAVVYFYVLWRYKVQDAFKACAMALLLPVIHEGTWFAFYYSINPASLLANPFTGDRAMIMWFAVFLIVYAFKRYPMTNSLWYGTLLLMIFQGIRIVQFGPEQKPETFIKAITENLSWLIAAVTITLHVRESANVSSK